MRTLRVRGAVQRRPGHDGGVYQPFELGPGDGMAIVTLRGELDAHDAPRLRELFGEAMEQVQGPISRVSCST